ncbi:MAG: hypothetical protein VX641_02650 [Planctomycetota bacterium]|nr:hypothetical protein [Planctomycetota bacterium]
MNLNEPVAQGTFELTSTIVEEGQSTLSFEGKLPNFGMVWATHTLQVGGESRISGTLVGNGRALNDEGDMLASVISGLWSRQKEILHLTTLDQLNTGDQVLVRCEVNLRTKQASVTVFEID